MLNFNELPERKTKFWGWIMFTSNERKKRVNRAYRVASVHVYEFSENDKSIFVHIVDREVRTTSAQRITLKLDPDLGLYLDCDARWIVVTPLQARFINLRAWWRDLSIKQCCKDTYNRFINWLIWK